MGPKGQHKNSPAKNLSRVRSGFLASSERLTLQMEDEPGGVSTFSAETCFALKKEQKQANSKSVVSERGCCVYADGHRNLRRGSGGGGGGDHNHFKLPNRTPDLGWTFTQLGPASSGPVELAL